MTTWTNSSMEPTAAALFRATVAVVRTRLMEPGEMASPQKPVFSLAITDPKWVRAYVSEPDLGKVQPGMTASVMVAWPLTHQAWATPHTPSPARIANPPPTHDLRRIGPALRDSRSDPQPHADKVYRLCSL